MRVTKSKSRKTLKESQIEALNLSSLADLIYAYGNDLRVLHLNVKGAGFRSVHEALNELYDDVFEAYDAVAELAIARGEKVKNPSTVVSIIKPLEARPFNREEVITIAREEGLKVLDAVCSIEGYDKAVQPVLDDIIVKLDKTLNYIFSRWSDTEDAASDPERSIVAKELVVKGYLDDDLWSSDLEESVKKPLKESVSEKPFDEVEEGDTGRDYSGNEVIILAKGPASKFSNADGFEEFVDLSDYDPEDTGFNNQIDAEWPECVLVEFVEDGSEVVYSYGSDGVVVPQNRVRQISFDFIDNGSLSEEDIISRIQDAMITAGVEIVGGPAFGDTSWSKEEYGLK